MSNKLSEVERTYYVHQVGGASPTTPLNQIKRQHWISVIGGNAQTPFNQLETDWMLHVISNSGFIPLDPHSNAALWKQMVISIGLTPTKNIDENKMIFYIGAFLSSDSPSYSQSTSPSASPSISPSASVSISPSASPSV
jgi:hypothetical protein